MLNRAVRTATKFLLVVFTFAMLGSLAQAQTYKVLYSFTGGKDGSEPTGTVTQDSTGTLYGTTLNGGAKGLGTVFKIKFSKRATTESVIHSFRGKKDGINPLAGVTLDSTGDLLGTTNQGGTYNAGILFQLKSSKETVLHTFGGRGDGVDAPSGVIQDAASGNVFGITYYGGAAGDGTIFKLTPAGIESILYSFFGSADANPDTALLQDGMGNLYGAARGGGGPGEVFEWTSFGTEAVVHAFSGPDGYDPRGNLVIDSFGNLYGTTFNGGAYGNGVVYKIDPSQVGSVLYSFQGGLDGGNPQGGLAIDELGNLYGTTFNGGASSCGVVFMLDTSGNETVLHQFEGGSDGQSPYSGLLLNGSGTLYGTTYIGGTSGFGTVFQISGSHTGHPSVKS